jgi:hypothetical protein
MRERRRFRPPFANEPEKVLRAELARRSDRQLRSAGEDIFGRLLDDHRGRRPSRNAARDRKLSVRPGERVAFVL